MTVVARAAAAAAAAAAHHHGTVVLLAAASQPREWEGRSHLRALTSNAGILWTDPLQL